VTNKNVLIAKNQTSFKKNPHYWIFINNNFIYGVVVTFFKGHDIARLLDVVRLSDVARLLAKKTKDVMEPWILKCLKVSKCQKVFKSISVLKS
jgi:hypothetical protein